MDRNVLARKLRELRLNAGLSQQILGSRLRRAQSYISKIENAERRVEMFEIEGWAKACGKAMYWTFVDLEEAEKGAPPPSPSGRPDVGGGVDHDTVASVAWLLPRLAEQERTLLLNTIHFLMERHPEGARDRK